MVTVVIAEKMPHVHSTKACRAYCPSSHKDEHRAMPNILQMKNFGTRVLDEHLLGHRCLDVAKSRNFGASVNKSIIKKYYSLYIHKALLKELVCFFLLKTEAIHFLMWNLYYLTQMWNTVKIRETISWKIISEEWQICALKILFEISFKIIWLYSSLKLFNCFKWIKMMKNYEHYSIKLHWWTQ